VKSPYLNEKSPDFDKIWYTTADAELVDNHVNICKKIKIQDVGRLHVEYRFFDHNSTADCTILVKFCAGSNFGNRTTPQNAFLLFTPTTLFTNLVVETDNKLN